MRLYSKLALLLTGLAIGKSSSAFPSEPCHQSGVAKRHGSISARVFPRQAATEMKKRKGFSYLHRLRNTSIRTLPLLRGGSQRKHDQSALKAVKSAERNEERSRRRGMAVALSSTYFAVMGAKCALPSVLSLLTSPETGLSYDFFSSSKRSPQDLMAGLLTLSTLAVAVGKLVLGPCIDRLGGIRSLQLALISLTLLVSVITVNQQFHIFAICWIFVDFIFSSCWAGCISAIHQSFPESQWGRQIGFLAAGARTGNAVAFSLFASILYGLENKVEQSWRFVFGVSALLQLIPIALLSYFGRRTLEVAKTGLHPRERPTIGDTLATLRREASTIKFWCHLLSRSCLMVFASFLLFVPTLMSQVYGSSSAFAAQTGSIYALGCLLSVTTGSELYPKLPKKKQALSIFIMLGAATVSSLAQLAHVGGIWKMTPKSSSISLFLWGWAFAVPFYIPPSLYALERGGARSSATIADAFDIGGFSSLALFNGYVASIRHSHPAAWIPTFLITTACSAISMIALPLAILAK